jgi:hypothetical protein
MPDEPQDPITEGGIEEGTHASADASEPSAPDLRPEEQLEERLASPTSDVARAHLKGLLEALIFASDHPQKAADLARAASANVKEVRDLLADLKVEYQPRGVQLDEVAGGWLFRTSPAYAPFVRDLTKQKPVRLSRAQIETLAIGSRSLARRSTRSAESIRGPC